MKFMLYRDILGKWRWSLVAKNNRKVADSGEGYERRGDCEASIQRIKRSAARAKVVEAPVPE